MSEAPLLTLPEVAERLSVSVKAVRGLVARGELPAFKVARRMRVEPSELGAYLERCRVAPSPARPLPQPSALAKPWAPERRLRALLDDARRPPPGLRA